MAELGQKGGGKEMETGQRERRWSAAQRKKKRKRGKEKRKKDFPLPRKQNKIIENRIKPGKIQEIFWELQKLKHNHPKIKYAPV